MRDDAGIAPLQIFITKAGALPISSAPLNFVLCSFIAPGAPAPEALAGRGAGPSTNSEVQPLAELCTQCGVPRRFFLEAERLMERAALFVLAGHKGNGVAVAALAHAVQQGFVQPPTNPWPTQSWAQ